MSPPAANLEPLFQSFLDDAVANDVAPGLQCVIFNRDTVLFNGVSGLAASPSDEAPQGKPYKRESLGWLASCTKVPISLILLQILERNQTKTGITLNDLDDHEKFVEVVPEFKHGSGSLVTKIFEGFEDQLGPDGKKVLKVRDAKGKVTLRMLLTHTAGIGYDWNHHYLAELYNPRDGSVPNNAMPPFSGDIRDIEVPLVYEPGSRYFYGGAADWIGQFLVRATGKGLRALFKEYIFTPLCIPENEADLWLTPSLRESSLAPIHVRDGKGGYTHAPFPLYNTEDAPPPGKQYFSGACMYGSLQAYSKILQAVLREDTRLLSKELWKTAFKDDLGPRGLKIPVPEWKTSLAFLSPDMDVYEKSTVPGAVGTNFLQAKVALAPTASGRPTGSFAWAGLANAYWFIDPVSGVGAVFGTQILPFYDEKVVQKRDELERLVYKHIVG